MPSERPPFDQRLAAILVRPLVRTPVTPNQISALCLAIALAGAWLLTKDGLQTWGAGLFALSRFIDHADGELARQTGRTSRLGYYLDYAVGGISYAALFFAMGWAFQSSALGLWAIVLGSGGAAAAILSMFTNLDLDRQSGGDQTGDAVGYPGYAGFELEDGIYLLWPVTWLGWLYPFFVAASVGATIYFIWTLFAVLRGRRRGG